VKIDVLFGENVEKTTGNPARLEKTVSFSGSGAN
jgi:hypothetical protein